MFKRIIANIEAMCSKKSTREIGYKNRSFQDIIDQNYHIMNPEQRLIPDIAKKYCNKGNSFLELGCGAGRNLECLRQHGYKKLYGVDASKEAINVSKHYFPELAKIAQLKSGFIQNISENNKFDVIYSVAVLQHILSDIEPVFYKISRIAKKFIITIEFDFYAQKRKNHKFKLNPKERIPRDYNKIFSNLGFRQMEVFGCWEIPIKLNAISTKFTPNKQSMLNELRNFIIKNKRCPTAGESNNGLFKNNVNAYEKQFGSWLSALEASGIEKPYSGHTYTVRIFQKK